MSALEKMKSIITQLQTVYSTLYRLYQGILWFQNVIFTVHV